MIKLLPVIFLSLCSATATSGENKTEWQRYLRGNLASREPLLSRHIVVDQFGYPRLAQKVAVIRDPRYGYDAGEVFEPGKSYGVVDARTGALVSQGEAVSWQSGRVDESSGDRAYWYNFTTVTQPGTYYVVDLERNVRSDDFDVRDDVYGEVLRHAVRTFFYQRAGFPKKAEHAGKGWADEASHVGPKQDKNARLFSASEDLSTERDLSGGWYDAGDYNKYTNFTARALITLMKAYLEHPTAFTDDYGIPESGNGIPDVIDEIKWGVQWLTRMQNSDGSVLSIVDLSHASPPSAALGPSLYGPANTSATLSAAAAFGLAAKVLQLSNETLSSVDLLARAKAAYGWAEANANVVFKNNDESSGTRGLGAGQQETDDLGRQKKKVEASIYLFELTHDVKYRMVVDTEYTKFRLFSHGASAYDFDEIDALLYYSELPGAHSDIALKIKKTFCKTTVAEDNRTMAIQKDPYRAFIPSYTWGSNRTKALQGMMLYRMTTCIGAKFNPLADPALAYINYIHGVNPLGIVYLSNMYSAGAQSSVNEIYHSWFTDGSPIWDRVGKSRFGPPPGFLVGGPNPRYDWDRCCPGNCGLSGNMQCVSGSIMPPKGQPPQKSYKDFNAGWPLNSWTVTENSIAYQAAYVRLLSKFVKKERL